MPRGAYLLADPHEGPYALERFSCAPGPAGWRYVATREQPGTGAPLGRLDLTADGAGRVVRLRVQSGGWEVRGGQVGPDVLWRRGDEEHARAAAGFTGTSPAYDVVLARRLGLAVGGRTRVRLVALTDPVLAARTVEQEWSLVQVQERSGVSLTVYAVDDLATGQRRTVHLAGDVALDALVELAGAPTLTRP